MIVLLGRLCDIHGTQRLVKSYILPCIIFLINLWYNFSLVLQAFLCRLCRLDFVATFYKYFRSGQSHLKSRNNMLESPSNFVIFDLLKKHVNCKHIITQNKNFVCTGQLIIMALIQAIKLLFMAVIRLLFWFDLIALERSICIRHLESCYKKIK